LQKEKNRTSVLILVISNPEFNKKVCKKNADPIKLDSIKLCSSINPKKHFNTNWKFSYIKTTPH